MEIKGHLIKRGEVISDMDKISEDCVINIDKVNPVVTWQFNEQKPLGVVCSVDIAGDKDKSVSVVIKLNEHGEKFIKRIQDNYTISVGCLIKKRKKNKIKDFDVTSVSIINKR